ncbi:MAG: DNA recombination protein RmuC [Candidatus Cryptobacteroides sp.]
MDITVSIAIIAAVVIIAIVVIWVVSSGKARMADRIARQNAEIEEKESELVSLRATVEGLKESLAQRDRDLAKAEAAVNYADELRKNDEKRHEQAVAELKENYAKALAGLEEAQKKAIDAARAELALENEKNLKAREEALKKEAAETMKNITGGLDQTIKGMTEAFEAQKKTHAEDTTSIKTQFAETVKHLKEQTETIGNTAEDLAKALKGQSKVQGIFGETILENILKAENLTEGRDYDAEFWLRDKRGNRIVNDETGKTMRPDFALHFPDNTDILIDSKVSLTALADYFAAETDEERAAASARNLASIENHIRELTSKEYQKYVAGRKTLDYVIMFIPNYGAYQLAKMEDKDIFAKAFRQNVLITTEETLIPFLRLIRTAWVQKEQMENIGEIVKAATDMVERVGIFCHANAEIESKIEGVLKDFRKNTTRLVDGNQSIVKAAQRAISHGIKAPAGKNALPGVGLEPELEGQS